MKGLFLALCLVLGTASFEAKACGDHACNENFGYGFVGYGSRPFFFPPPFWGGQAGGFYGPGAKNFRRSFRLRNQAWRAAWNGNWVRASRLSWRSQNQFARGVSQGGGFFIRPWWF